MAKTAKQEHILTTAANHPKLSTRQIAKICNTDHSYVVQLQQRYNITKDITEQFKNHRADIFAGYQDKLLSSVTDTDIKKASLMQRMASVGILYDKERLERGLSTGNFVNIQADLEAFRQAKQVQQDTQEDLEIIDI